LIVHDLDSYLTYGVWLCCKQLFHRLIALFFSGRKQANRSTRIWDLHWKMFFNIRTHKSIFFCLIVGQNFQSPHRIAGGTQVMCVHDGTDSDRKTILHYDWNVYVSPILQAEFGIVHCLRVERPLSIDKITLAAAKVSWLPKPVN
jgi:hypothetical protein